MPPPLPWTGIEIAITALIACLSLAWRGQVQTFASSIATRTWWCMAALAAMPIVLRLLLLPNFPVPTPTVSDDFSYLLLADTLSHLRLANPPHPYHRFFETFFVLQEPSYSSIFPLGQGILLAVGRAVTGTPWFGVLASIGCLSALTYWMLRGWVSAGWALTGGVLAVIQFGPLHQWMNSYWGGAVSGIAGCLVFGSLPRLLEHSRTRDAGLLGLGLGIQLLTRPFEFVFLALGAAVFLAVEHRRVRRRAWLLPLGVILGCGGLMLLHNRAVTKSWLTLPYELSRTQYGVPAAFTFEQNPVPQRPLTPQQQLDYQAQSAVHGEGVDSLQSYFERLLFRIRYYRFYFLAPLYLTLPFFLPYVKQFRFAWVAGVVLLFALGTNFYPYFYSHYIAALTPVFVMIAVVGLDRISNLSGRLRGADAAQLIVVLCISHFVFWYGLHLVSETKVSSALRKYETWDAINHGDPEGRISVSGQLSRVTGKQLVFVHYSPRHTFNEWVHNAADIDNSRIVWARDLGAEENEKLRGYYPDRTAWMLEPDVHPPRLTRLARPVPLDH